MTNPQLSQEQQIAELKKALLELTTLVESSLIDIFAELDVLEAKLNSREN